MAPVSIALTEFHVIKLFEDRMQVLCTINDKIVQTYNFQPTVRDPSPDLLLVLALLQLVLQPTTPASATMTAISNACTLF